MANTPEENKTTETAGETKISKEAGAILLLSQHQDEYFSTVLTALASIEAHQIVNQNLLMTLLAAKGLSDDEIEALKKQNSEQYKEYKNTLLKALAAKLEEFKDHFTKFYAE